MESASDGPGVLRELLARRPNAQFMAITAPGLNGGAPEAVAEIDTKGAAPTLSP